MPGSRQTLFLGLVGFTLLLLSQPDTPPVEWNDPGLMEFSNVTLFINGTCPETITTAMLHTITLTITIASLNDANNATHAYLTVQWSWSRPGAPAPSYQSSEHTFPHLSQGQNCTLTDTLYVRAVDVGIWPGQTGYNHLMLTYTIERCIYSSTDPISSGQFSHSQNIPVIAGTDAYETPLALSSLFVLGSGIIVAIIAEVYYLRKDE